MDSNNPPIHADNLENNDSSTAATDPIIDITQGGPTSAVDSNRQPLMTPEAQQEFVEMLMTVEEEDDDMPSLYEASFTESDRENIAVDSNLGAQDNQIPTSQQTHQNNDSSSSPSQSTASSNYAVPLPSTSSQPQRRRARVEDDHDEDRDRRHPSQRVGSNNDQPATPNHPPNHPPNPFFAPFFTSFRDAGAALGLGTGFLNRIPVPNPSENYNTPNTNSNENNTDATDATDALPGTPASSSQPQNPEPSQNANASRRAPMHFVDYEFSIIMDGSRLPQPVNRVRDQVPPSNDPNVQGQQGGNAPNVTPFGPAGAGTAWIPPHITLNPPMPLGNLQTLLGMPFPLPGGGFAFPQLPEEKEDPERARKLVDGLEEVPIGLVRRLERVGTGGGGMGEDETKGGDVGCAICWDRLLPGEVYQERTEEPPEGNDNMVVDEEAEGAQEKSEPKHPKVVSLPCAHVFHAECLLPWFSRPRHTTCPTCRFNIDPDDLTYVSARQRRREQRRAANNNDGNPPSEATGGEEPAATPATAATTDTGEQPASQQDQRGGTPVLELGGFADIIQMLNTQGQSQQRQQPPATTANVASPSGSQPQAREPPPLVMPIPMPTGGPGNLFPAGFTAGQLPMPMAVPFMPIPLPHGNAQGLPIPMPMPWRMMANPIQVGTGRTNANNADTSGGIPDAINANTTPANGSSNNSQAPPPHQNPTILADIVRISVDMVFDERPRRQANQGRTDTPAAPQPATEGTNPSQETQHAAQEQVPGDDTDGDHDFEDDLPPLMSVEEAEEQDRQFAEFLGRMNRNHQNPVSNNGNGPAPAANDNSEPPAPPVQPAGPHPQHRDPRGFPAGGIHVAGTGRSLGEAFSQALSRLQRQMAQPPQEGQNPQPADASTTADENAPPAPGQTQAEPQGQGQRPWQFMSIPMPFIDFGIPMRPSQPEGPKRPWALPPAPGSTLRQRIERREREAGIRCHDVSCGLGPSDEDPLGDDTLPKVQQLSIMSNEDDRKPVCEHRFHSACLVSAERVALRGAEIVTNEAGGVEVSCPVCRATGCVAKEQWDEGVSALQ